MIRINLDKAKAIGHDMRRAKRAEEFAPLDVQVTVPALAAEVEAKRQAIRERYAEIQDQIDAAQSPDEIKAALDLELTARRKPGAA